MGMVGRHERGVGGVEKHQLVSERLVIVIVCLAIRSNNQARGQNNFQRGLDIVIR